MQTRGKQIRKPQETFNMNSKILILNSCVKSIRHKFYSIGKNCKITEADLATMSKFSFKLKHVFVRIHKILVEIYLEINWNCYLKTVCM